MIKSVLIVGGGTAGWCAAHLFRSYIPKSVKITLIESPMVPTIGVGESSTPLFGVMLSQLCPWLDEAEFIAESNAVFKVGATFQDWHKVGHTYHTPYNDSQDVQGIDHMRIWALANGKPTHKSMLADLMLSGSSPYVKNVTSLQTRAYNFDQAMAAAYLKSKAKQGNIEYIQGTIKQIVKNENGAIKSVILDDGQELNYDFYVDSSGPAKILARAMDIKFVSWKKYSLVDTAINFPLPLPADEPIPTSVRAIAKRNGWQWKTPTFDRYGAGYVFSSQFINAEQALAEIQETLPNVKSYIKEIKFEPGYLEKCLEKNVLVIGLASGFLEPLEGTSIHRAIENLIAFLKDYFMTHVDFGDECMAKSYNKFCTNGWYEALNWVTIHYQNCRTDTDYWRAVAELPKPDIVAELTDLWKYRCPRSYDTTIETSKVLFSFAQGIGLITPEIAQKELDYLGGADYAKDQYEKLERRVAISMARATPHREHLEHIRTTRKL